MCQLTFINSNNKELNKKLLVSQFLMNTVTTHRDGWGFFTKESGVCKTSLNPWQTANLGDLIKNKIKNSEPILAHVRLATATNNIKDVCDENSHPFETKDFIVAHNGSFEGDALSEKRFKDKIDSEIFAILLQETFDKYPKLSIIKLIDKAYSENLTGKFAFLIYCKPVNKFYIVRGKTAKLYKSEILLRNPKTEKDKKVGFIVNTEKIELLRSFRFASANHQLETGESFVINEPVELKENTVYQVHDKFLRELGNVEEKIKTVAVTANNANNFGGFQHNHGGYNRNISTPAQKVKTPEDFLLDLYDLYGLTLPEIDLLFLEITGLPIIASPKENFSIFEEMIEPYLEMHTKHKADLWVHLGEKFFDKMEVYEHFDLQFPYFVNEVSALNNRWIKEKTRRVKEEKAKQC
jgi:predicted glutamine amidotransferase